MLIYHRWDDLRKDGVNILTAEACAYGYRVLCDLNENGVSLVNNLFSSENIKVEFHLPECWNSTVCERNDAIKSIMLPRAMFEPLAVMACFKRKCSDVYILHKDDGSMIIVGIEDKDSSDQFDALRMMSARLRVFRYHNPGYSRNVHQMSGRVI